MSKEQTGSIMRTLRERAGLSQRQIAQALEVTDQTVSNWETGQRQLTLSPEKMFTLCTLLQCSLADLAGQNSDQSN